MVNHTMLFLRRNSRRRWVAGRQNAGLSEPTKEEVGIFLTGFNMGYDCCKSKRIKDIPDDNKLKVKP